MLIVGIVILAVGIADFVVAAVLTRQAAGSSGLGGAPPSPVIQILRRSGAVAVAVGAVLVIVGLAS